MFRRIGTLETAMAARKMTNFTRDQLTRLYEQFGLAEYCQVRNQDYIRVPTGHAHNGSQCFYRFDPEELFLCALTRCATGMTMEKIIDNYFGGHYSRWSYGYQRLILYIDEQYENIIGNQGNLRFLPDFTRFRDAIE